MSNFLADLGRSNALTNAGDTLFRNAINLRQVQNQEEQQGFQRAIDLEKVGMLKAAADRETQTFNIDITKKKNELEESEKNRARRAKPISDIRLNPVFRAFPEDSQNNFFEFGKQNGRWDNSGATTVGDVEDTLSLVNKNPAAFNSIMSAPLIRKAESEYESAFSEYQKVKDKPGVDPGKVKEAHGAMMSAYSAMEKTKGNMSGFAKEVTANATREELLQSKLDSAKAIAEMKAENAKAIADMRVEVANRKSSEKDGDREQVRTDKLHKESRSQVEKLYGYSQFLPQAQDPSLLKKVGLAVSMVEDIIDNPGFYGMGKSVSPGKAAAKAKEVTDRMFSLTVKGTGQNTPSAPTGNSDSGAGSFWKK